MTLTRRTMGAVSRRLGRPELLAAMYPGARQALHEEIALSAVLASTLRADATYVDVGTNRGQVLREALGVAPQGRHVAFEPIPELAVEVAREFPQVDCRQLALGASPHAAQFCHFRKLDGWSGLRRSPEISDERGDPQYIDVEGAELAVLEGGRSVLAQKRPVVIFEHVAAAARLYDAVPGSPWDLLSELGYRVFSITGEGPFTREDFARSRRIVNWLATPSS